MAGYIGSKASVTQVDGYNQAEADAEFVNDPNGAITVDSSNNVGIGTSSPNGALDVNGDLYLSGGVYLGGTGSANKLDDYEEGTWTPTIYGTGGGSLTLNAGSTGKYVKIGRFVQLSVLQLQWTANSGVSGMAALGGIPFPSDYNRYSSGIFGGSSSGSVSITGQLNGGLDPSAYFVWIMYRDPTNNTYAHTPTFSSTGVIYGFTISYQTDA